MSAYNGNGIYLAIDGTDLSAYFVSVNLSAAVSSVDVTRGSGATSMARATGLNDNSITISIGYDDSAVATHLPLVGPGTHTVTYGPEGNTSGKPKHEQSFVFESTGHEVQVSKAHVVWQITGTAAAAPTTNMFNGGTW